MYTKYFKTLENLHVVHISRDLLARATAKSALLTIVTILILVCPAVLIYLVQLHITRGYDGAICQTILIISEKYIFS